MESVWSVSKLSTESVGSRRELVANCVHTADADATKQFRRFGVGGVYWAYTEKRSFCLSLQVTSVGPQAPRSHTHISVTSMSLRSITDLVIERLTVR